MVADQVSEPIEAAASQLAGVQQINTTSLQGYAVALVQFNFGVNTDTVQQQLTAKIGVAPLPISATGTTIQTTITHRQAIRVMASRQPQRFAWLDAAKNDA